MVAKIIAVNKSKGILATYWEFDFLIENDEYSVIEGTVSLDEAVGYAERSDLGPVAEMCRPSKRCAQ